jgi:hypothetical protein
VSHQSLISLQDFESYVSNVKQKSEDLIKRVFPKRIKELNDLLESPEFDLDLQKKGLKLPLNIPVPDPQAISRYIYKHLAYNNII